MSTAVPYVLEELRIELAKGCNCHCGYCYLGGNRASAVLAPRHVKAVLEKALPLGLTTVSFTGGEPLLHATLLRNFIQWSTRQCLETGVLTNATLLTPEVADMLAVAGLTWARISFDAPPGDSEVSIAHHRATDHVPDAVRLLQSRGIRVALRTTVSQQNWTRLADLVASAREHGVTRLEIQPFFPVGDPWVDSFYTMPPATHVRAAAEALRLRRSISSRFDLVLYSGWFEFLSSEYDGEPIRPSRCGRQFLFLDAEGWFKTCGPARRRLLHSEAQLGTLEGIWLNEPYLNAIRSPKPEGLCAECAHFSSCRYWCPAVNTVLGLSPAHPIPTCPKVMLWKKYGLEKDERRQHELRSAKLVSADVCPEPVGDSAFVWQK